MKCFLVHSGTWFRKSWDTSGIATLILKNKTLSLFLELNFCFTWVFFCDKIYFYYSVYRWETLPCARWDLWDENLYKYEIRNRYLNSIPLNLGKRIYDLSFFVTNFFLEFCSLLIFYLSEET